MPRGGYRPGAGRPKGSRNALGIGEVRAVKAARLKVPDDATEDERALAQRAFDRLVDVMEGRVHFQESSTIMAAATRVRELICGKEADRHILQGPDGDAPTVRFEWITNNPKKEEDNVG